MIVVTYIQTTTTTTISDQLRILGSPSYGDGFTLGVWATMMYKIGLCFVKYSVQHFAAFTDSSFINYLRNIFQLNFFLAFGIQCVSDDMNVQGNVCSG